MRKKKIKRLKVLYAVFFFVLFLELLGSLGAVFFGDTSMIRDSGMTNTFLVVFTAIAILIPMAIESKYNIEVPDFLEVLLLVMLFVGVVLGFLNDYYANVKNFDKFTHTLSGVTLSVIAFQALYTLNRSKNIAFKMEPLIMSVFAYTLSITLLVIWEFYEFLSDVISYNLDNDSGRNMQRYQWINDSLIFPQDYGLYDTMIDLFVGSIGSLIVVVVGYLLIRHNKILTK
ncbi:MAG: hypothetical protein QM489_04125 [Candidatus Izemoplasma sp.]